MDSAGNLPALDYVEGADEASDPELPFTDKDLGSLEGYLNAIRFEGPNGLTGGSKLIVFKGEDAKDGMCELRFGAKRGHRLLCFKRAPQRFVVACGFRKPGQQATPPACKVRARRILREHEARRRE